MMKRIHIAIIISCIMLLVPFIVTALNSSCISNNTLVIQSSYTINANLSVTILNLTKEIYCPYGCTNNQCEGSSPETSNTSIWLVFGAGFGLLALSIYMVNSQRKEMLEGKDKVGIDTNQVIKFMFFFVGIYLVYMAFGMQRRASLVYGSESNIIGGMDAASFAILITIVIFSFVFVIEFFMMVMRMMKEQAEEKKWGERSE